MNADGTNLRRAANRDYDRHPSFAPDGQRFVFDSSVNNRQLFLATLTGPDSNRPGQEFQLGWEIYTMWGDGEGLERVTDNCWNEVQPRISSEGRWLVFASDAVGDFNLQPGNEACNQARDYNIWRLNLKNPTKPEQLTTSPAKEWQPAWSPYGKQVAFASDEAGNFNIYVMNADGIGRLQLTTDLAEDSLPYWISNTAIVFYSGRSDDGDIYQVNTAGGEATPLVQNPGFDWSPAVSPDGRTLIFASTRDTEGTYPIELYALNLATGTIKRLTEEIEEHDGTPLWSGDGRRIYFDSTRYYGTFDVWVMGLTEGMTADENSPPKNLTQDDRSDRLGTP